MILGIWDGHDSGIACVDRDGIRLALNEERLTRRKLEIHFPKEALGHVPASDEPFDVAYCTTDPSKVLGRYVPGTKERYYQVRRRKVVPSPLNAFTKSYKYKLTTFRPGPISRTMSARYMRQELRKAGLIMGRVAAHDHHYCHLCAAAFTAGPGDWTVISLDGVGDGRSGAVAELREGTLRQVESIHAEASLGIFFEHVTNLMNMRELEDEGKVMALANFASPIPDEKNPLFDFVRVEGLTLRTSGPTSAMYGKLRKIFQCYPSEQFAAMAQRVLECRVVELVSNAVGRTGLFNVAYAGGVAANIKANMLINELDCVDKLHVFPHMGDGGLAMGAALAMAHRKWGRTHWDLGNCYLGFGYSSDEIKEALESAGVSYEKVNDIGARTAGLLCDGVIVPFHQGRMEYGPRALGNRSILALPNSLEIKNRLNLALKKRVYYQPFCPSMLASEADRVLACGKSYNSYMTIGYRVRPEHRSAMDGVINVDGTCRPQIIPDDADTPMAAVLRELKKRTGYGVVLNTSLNVHGQPLACSPRDTLAVVREMGAKAAVMGEFVITRENGS